MVEDRLLYDVKLTYPVSTLDVWNKYILVGTFPVQLFEMKMDRLRRIVVVDSEDDTHSTKVRILLYNQPFVCAFTLVYMYRKVET